MTRVVINLPLDKTGINPSNLSMNEAVTTIRVRSGIRIATLEHGGFYEVNLKVYNDNYNELLPGIDYVLGYHHKQVSDLFGLKIYSVIVLINDSISDELFVSAQMVGGDSAYSFTAIDDYTNFILSKPNDYVPANDDYLGTETVYGPKELELLRWKLDTYQPFNNEINKLSRAVSGLAIDNEESIRLFIRNKTNEIEEMYRGIGFPHVFDFNNPHEDNQNDIGLGLINNYRVATKQEAEEGVSNNVYLTPKLTWDALVHQAFPLIEAHENDFNDPHETTPEQLKAPIKTVVDESVDKKYYLQEVVSNSRNMAFNGNKSYSAILEEFRANIPATNFTTGLVNVARMASGTANATNVLTSNPQRWLTWKSLISSFNTGDVVVTTFASNISRANAHNFIATNAQFKDLPNNSIVLYKVRLLHYDFYTNGRSIVYRWYPFASYKNQNGVWIQV